jgi:hypothetical protein
VSVRALFVGAGTLATFAIEEWTVPWLAAIVRRSYGVA